jgi:TfoX/Sxy family transcriptional regulator of competence genes
MSSSRDFAEFVCDQIKGTGEIRYQKMFGEYMIYVNHKPILLICDDTVYVKINEETIKQLKDAEKGFPYQGAKEHYILDIDQQELCKEIVLTLEKITPLPKKKKQKKNI